MHEGARLPQPPARVVPGRAVPYASPAIVTFRDGSLERDNGNCKNAATVDFFYGGAPTKIANCKPNEVEVPNVRGSTLAKAKARLYGQPLLWTVVYKPAKPGQRLSIVIGQIPRGGTLSAYDRVTLVVPKPLHGVVPRLVGLTVARREASSRRLKAHVRVHGHRSARVVAQQPGWGVAAAPGMRVVLTVRPERAAEEARAGEAVAPGPVGRLA